MILFLPLHAKEPSNLCPDLMAGEWPVVTLGGHGDCGLLCLQHLFRCYSGCSGSKLPGTELTLLPPQQDTARGHPAAPWAVVSSAANTTPYISASEEVAAERIFHFPLEPVCNSSSFSSARPQLLPDDEPGHWILLKNPSKES